MGGQSGTITLFLRNLPPNTSRKDLKTFVHDELREAKVSGLPLFSLCTNCTILCITDRATGTVAYHGLVEVKPARIGLRAIQVLNGRELHGTPIEVHRYRHRSAWGEHRQRSEDGGSGQVVARPLMERRRANLKIDLVESTPSAQPLGATPIPT